MSSKYDPHENSDFIPFWGDFRLKMIDRRMLGWNVEREAFCGENGISIISVYCLLPSYEITKKGAVWLAGLSLSLLIWPLSARGVLTHKNSTLFPPKTVL